MSIFRGLTQKHKGHLIVFEKICHNDVKDFLTLRHNGFLMGLIPRGLPRGVSFEAEIMITQGK